MVTRISSRAGTISAFHVMDILAKARQIEQRGRRVCHLEIGEPDLPTPDLIVAAGQQSLNAKQTFYTQAVGLPALRHAISDYYQRRYAVDVPWQRIIITPGASGAIQLALLSLLDEGEELLLPDPGYPCNRNIARILDVDVKPIPVDAATGFHLSAEHVAAHWNQKTRAAMVASPANPTGTIIANDQLYGLYQAIHERGGTLIVDEIYQGLVYGDMDSTVLQQTGDCVVINSFSKYFAMTGWRVGWMVVPDVMVDAIDRIAQNLFLAPPTIAQHAALTALSEDAGQQLDLRRDEFEKRKDFLLPAIRALGFEVPVEPQGAFYIYADCSRLTDDSFRFCMELLNDQAVAITPGIDFGEHQAEKYCRFAYTQPLPVLESAIERIQAFTGT
jgi:aspartate/methionine/tyrosine aminotransferase